MSPDLDFAPILHLDGSSGAGREVLGGKAWSIETMRASGIPVPPAFVLTTAVCRRYYDTADGAESVPGDVWQRIPEAIGRIENEVGRTFGGGSHPLLVSVRSGAATSMPGMMDTVLNLGMTDRVERAMAERSGDAAFADDTRRRFIDQFQKVVGRAAPEDPWEQLHLAVDAVLGSWRSRRAVAYRRDRGIPDDGGTAVTIQAMVFGNLDDDSGTGVMFSRDPVSGTPAPYGEWLPRGQGEDVVSGRSDALPIAALAEAMPEVHTELIAAARRLESDGRDVQDIEFTVESGKLWLLQARAAKRSPEAAVRHAVALHREGVLSDMETLDRVTAEQVEALLKPRLDPDAVPEATVLASGKAACPGFAVGTVITDSAELEQEPDDGRPLVLARPTTDPDDVPAMAVSRAVITELGGSTSHAAVVCRELAVPCVVGCGPGALTGLLGSTVTVDGNSGTVYEGALPVIDASRPDDPDLAALTECARRATGADGALPELLRLHHRRNAAEGG